MKKLLILSTCMLVACQAPSVDSENVPSISEHTEINPSLTEINLNGHNDPESADITTESDYWKFAETITYEGKEIALDSSDENLTVTYGTVEGSNIKEITEFQYKTFIVTKIAKNKLTITAEIGTDDNWKYFDPHPTLVLSLQNDLMAEQINVHNNNTDCMEGYYERIITITPQKLEVPATGGDYSIIFDKQIWSLSKETLWISGNEGNVSLSFYNIDPNKPPYIDDVRKSMTPIAATFDSFSGYPQIVEFNYKWLSVEKKSENELIVSFDPNSSTQDRKIQVDIIPGNNLDFVEFIYITQLGAEK